MNLIYDRTAEDVERALALAKKAEAGTLTDAEKNEWLAGMKGCYNASDLNRVEAAVKSIAAALNAAGYAVEVGETKHTTVPEGYTILEYIESTGTQYVDTGFKPSQNTRIKMSAHIIADGSSSSWYALYGARTAVRNADMSFWLNGALGTQIDFGNVSDTSITATSANLEVDQNKNVATLNGKSVTLTANTFTAAYDLYLFCVNTAGSLSYYTPMQLKSCQIYDNGTLVRDFIPCKTPSGEIGLYDTITQSFYGNVGTGTFTAGTEIGSHDWHTTDIVRLSQWRQYLANVQALRDAYYTLAETGQLPDAEDRLDYVGANNIEKVLADIDLLIGWMKSSYRRCGTFRAGNNAAHLPLKGSA